MTALAAPGGPVLVGRTAEQRRLQQLLDEVRGARGESLAIVGEPGIGKSALLDAAAAVPGVRPLRLDGYEAESHIPFGAAQRIVLPLNEWMPSVPDRQREALEVAGGRVDGPPPDRYLVGLGLLALLCAASKRTPMVCIVDDCHLLDAESLDVLAFVARRVTLESVGVLFATRDERDVLERLRGVPELRLVGIDTTSSVSLLRRSLSTPVDPAVAATVATATGGNPLALIDLAEEMTALELGRRRLADEPVPIGPRLEAHYLQRVRRAGPSVSEWMLVAAAAATGSVEFVDAAALRLGVDESARDRAEHAGLVDLRTTVRFRHPLVTSAVYNAATGVQRRRVHRALADAADDLGLVELEAWHAARSILGTDAEVADRLERSADTAARRGGGASRASILSRAAELTPEGPVRDERLVAAAEAALAVGAAHVAAVLLAEIDGEPTVPTTRGRRVVVRTAIGLFTADGSTRRAPAELLAAADDFHGVDPELELRSLIKAYEYCLIAGGIEGMTIDELGERIERGATAATGPWAIILAGLAALVLQPYEQAVPAVRAAAVAVRGLPDREMMELASLTVAFGAFLWEEPAALAGLERAAGAAGDAGALQMLDTILWVAGTVELAAGSIVRARRYDELVRELRRSLGYDGEHVVNAALMAWGDAPSDQILAIAEAAGEMGFGGVTDLAIASLATRDLASGDVEAAFDKLLPLVEAPFLQVTPMFLADFVEAACGCGRSDRGIEHVAELERRASVNGSPRNRGLAHRSAALLHDGESAEAEFLASIEALASTSHEVDLARTHLVYGEWLVDRGRRRDAVEQLQLATTQLGASGADMFLARAECALGRAGAGVAAALTEQELAIARLAASGHTNAEIGSLLFVSSSTVDYHLRKVFTKLGVSSRRRLTGALAELGDPPD